MSKQRKLKGVIIGAGYFSHFQAEAWCRIPEVTIAAICDLSRQKAEVHMAKYGIARYYADYREMIDTEQPDFVDIVTPPSTHYEMSAYAAQHGVHVICQKPLAPTYQEAAQIVETVQAAGVRFMVHENWRWQPWYREIKRLMDADVLGEVFSLYFQMRTGDGWGEDAYLGRQPFFRDYERLLIYETGVHFIDAFRFLFGEITAIYANLRQLNPVIKGEDSGQVICHFDTGTSALFDSNRYNESQAADARYTFGTLRLDASKAHLLLDTNGDITIKPLGEPPYQHDYPHTRNGFAGDCVYALQRHFVEHLLNGQPFESNGTDYLKTIRAVEAVYESAATRQVVTLR